MTPASLPARPDVSDEEGNFRSVPVTEEMAPVIEIFFWAPAPTTTTSSSWLSDSSFTRSSVALLIVEGAGLIADERYVDGRFFPDLDRKAAVGSGRRTVCGAFDHDVRADDRFVGRGVDHASGNHVHVARLLDGGAAPPRGIC